MQTNQTRLLTLGAIMIGLALTRLLPHPVNFSPMAAIALLGGAHLMKNSQRYGIMLLAAVLSDVLVNSILYSYNDLSYVIQVDTLGIYACYMFFVWMGSSIKNVSFKSVGSRSLIASAVFFLVSNLMVWQGSGVYPANFSGLMACYTAAIPFLHNSFVGDLVFSGVTFGGFALLQKQVPALAIQR
jgi:hypothetical protein